MKDFTLKYSKNNDFRIFLVVSLRNAVFHDFLCFLFCAQFL